MVFCNKQHRALRYAHSKCHNPYFNRWFSAMSLTYTIAGLLPYVTILILIDGFLQLQMHHNKTAIIKEVTILILIDGFLQLTNMAVL